jgi:hypothetical protein
LNVRLDGDYHVYLTDFITFTPQQFPFTPGDDSRLSAPDYAGSTLINPRLREKVMQNDMPMDGGYGRFGVSIPASVAKHATDQFVVKDSVAKHPIGPSHAGPPCGVAAGDEPTLRTPPSSAGSNLVRRQTGRRPGLALAWLSSHRSTSAPLNLLSVVRSVSLPPPRECFCVN